MVERINLYMNKPTVEEIQKLRKQISQLKRTIRLLENENEALREKLADCCEEDHVPAPDPD